MFQTLKLLLPALIPSWHFFDVIAPSPRIEFRVLRAEEGDADNWQEFRPRPARISVFDMLKGMIFNPRWNESLFLMSCAERIMECRAQHSQQEILSRIWAELERNAINAPFIQFRLVFISRNNEELQRDITFISPIEGHTERSV